MNEFLPTTTVTLLFADIESPTRRWDTQPDAMAAALVRLDRVVFDIIGAHDGIGPVKQGLGNDDDGFVAVFGRVSDALACAVALQRAPLAPIQLRVGVHTGEMDWNDAHTDDDPTLTRAARLNELAHGGQVVLSGTTRDLVIDQLPAGVWLTDLGTHQLRDLPRPERVAQLCHADLPVEFPPLQRPNGVALHSLPIQLTRFVGRVTQTSDLVARLTQHRLVTLAGPGGVGKTRLALQAAAQLATPFGGEVTFVDLAPVTDPELVPVTVLRALGVPDQPGRSAIETLARFVADRTMLLVLDNCEHLLSACRAMVGTALSSCPRLTVLATSREPIGMPGELIWRVPSLSLTDEAVELFVDRALLARPDFVVADDDAARIIEICASLDGLPLGIEVAAARVRVMSLTEILDALRGRFRLGKDGAPTAERRNTTLGASIDWSHALLSEPERVLFRRLAAFRGGFDLEAARAAGAFGDLPASEVLDQLTLLVDKSLVVAENTRQRTRFRLLETMRHYAMEKLHDSGEADAVHARHRRHYLSMAAQLDRPGDSSRIRQVEIEIDNLRAAFEWCRENGEIDSALQLTSALQPLWLTRGRLQEGLAWFDAVLAGQIEQQGISALARGRALADKATLDASRSVHNNLDQAQLAVAIAREINDPALLARALTACGAVLSYSADAARPYLAEALGIARASGDQWRLAQILHWQAYGAFYAGDPTAAQPIAEEGRDVADAIGDQFHSRSCRWILGMAQMMKGSLAEAISEFRAVIAEADAGNDVLVGWAGRLTLSHALAFRGDISGAEAAARDSLKAAADLWEYNEGFSYALLATTAIAAGDVAAATAASEAAWQRLRVRRELVKANVNPMAEVALMRGDLVEAGRRADEKVTVTSGWHLVRALVVRARVALAKDEPDQAARDTHKALTCAAKVQAHLAVPDILECLASLAERSGSHHDAARLLGAAAEIRRRMGAVRFKIYDADHEQVVAAIQNALGEKVFESLWTEGAGLSLAEAIGYAGRGRGERRRPTNGWAALTPTERDVVRLVGDGLANNEIAARMFISRRTVQTHLTHVYTKLGYSSRVRLAHEGASRRRAVGVI